ncbi:MAG: right-handed parallel beta-helix repeat-containing protein [Deltaproteobacteria bacterium]|nr:right-handed parallel beta-helix repeat-containing protein [Deltaproteobacteria bacterium]
MGTTNRMVITLALLGVLSGMSTSWAGDSIKLVDVCQTISVGDRSSFILVRDLFSQGQDCLIVDSSDTTIDFNGFAIIGVGTGRGIISSASVHGVKIHNGTVRGFTVGVSLGGNGNLVENVHVENNTDTGIFLGAGSLAHHVVAQGNSRFGVLLSTACSFKDSIVRANGNASDSVGLSAGPGSTVSGNTIWANTGTGLFGSTGGTVIGNTVLDTLGVGISVICPSNLQQNTATANTGGNLVLAGGGCSAVNNVAP